MNKPLFERKNLIQGEEVALTEDVASGRLNIDVDGQSKTFEFEIPDDAGESEYFEANGKLRDPAEEDISFISRFGSKIKIGKKGDLESRLPIEGMKGKSKAKIIGSGILSVAAIITSGYLVYKKKKQ